MHKSIVVLVLLLVSWLLIGLRAPISTTLDLSFACSFPSTWGLITGTWPVVCGRVLHLGPCEACLSQEILVILYLLRKGNGLYHTIQFKYHNKAHALRCKLPSHKTSSMKKCPLTKKCGCWIYSHSIGCWTGVVGTCSLHTWNIQVSFVTENIFSITGTPRNDRCRVSFHLTDKWCSLFTANKDFWRKFNHRRNCYELSRQQQQNNKDII